MKVPLSLGKHHALQGRYIQGGLGGDDLEPRSMNTSSVGLSFVQCSLP